MYYLLEFIRLFILLSYSFYFNLSLLNKNMNLFQKYIFFKKCIFVL